MADQDDTKTIKIKAIDQTAAAIATAQKNFAKLPQSLAKDYKQLSNGLIISLKAVNDSAKQHGRTYKEQLKLTESALTGQNKYTDAVNKSGKAHQDAGNKGQKAMGGLNDIVGKGTTALVGMAAKALKVGAAMETIREGFLAFGKFDANLRKLQNTIGGSRTQIEGYGEMFKQVMLKTGDDLGQLQEAFKSFVDKSKIKPEEAKKMFPDIAEYAHGASTSVGTMAQVAADAMRNLNIPASDYKKVLESIVYASNKLSVDMGELVGQGSRMSEVMSSLGYQGAEGFAKMETFIGIANKATGSTSKSMVLLSNLMEKMVAGDQGIAAALDMSVTEMLDNIERAKKEGDPVGWMIGMFAKARDARAVAQSVGARDIKVVRQLQKELSTVGSQIEKTKNAMGGLDASKNALEGPDAAVNRLSASLSLLVLEIGHLLDALGVTTVLENFAEIIGGVASGLSRVVDLFNAVSRMELPAWWPKSWAEAWHRATGKRKPVSGELVTPWEETPQGKVEAAKAAKVVPLPEITVKPGAKPWTAGAPPGSYTQPYAVGQRPPAQKMSYQPQQQQAPGLTPAAFKKLGEALAKGTGGGYGSSLDAKYLQAAYHPGGGLGGDGGGGTTTGGGGITGGDYDAGPTGAHGTGYGGGTGLAPPSDDGTSPAPPPAGTEQPGPLKSGGGYNVVPEAPQTPGDPGGGGAIPSKFADDVTGMMAAGAGPKNIQSYLAAHGVHTDVSTCGLFMAEQVKKHGGTPPPSAGLASSWNNYGGREGAGYSSDPNAINVAVRQGVRSGKGSHVTAAIPIMKDGKIVGYRGVGVNQGLHGVAGRGQYGRDVISSIPLRIGNRPGEYQIRHEIVPGMTPNTAVASTGPAAAPAAAPAGAPGSSAYLAAQRKPYIDYLNAHPELKAKMAGLLVSEEPSREGRRGTAETLFNRMISHGVKPEQMGSSIEGLRGGRGVYYEPLRPGGTYGKSRAQMARDPQLAQETMEDIDVAGGGSNISNLGTQNASAGVATSAAATSTVTRKAIKNVSDQWSRKDDPRFAREHGLGTIRNEARFAREAQAAIDAERNAPVQTAAGGDNTPLGRAFAEKKRQDEAAKSAEAKKDVNVSLNVQNKEKDVQFARGSTRRTADREVREARWNSHADVGVA